MKNTIYMAVTADKYELPVSFGETAKDLGSRLGVSSNLIHSFISKGQSGTTRKIKFIKVKLSEEDED